MDSNMTPGARDLVLSGFFVTPAAAVRLRTEQGTPAAGYGRQHGCPTAHLAGAGTAGIGATVLFRSTSPIGTGVPVIDRMRVSAAEP